MQTLNLGILAHVDAGKTSLTERLLFEAGAIPELGSVDAGTTRTDSMDIERRRGITVRTNVASFAAGGVQVNLIDTPGHSDFIAEVERSLAALDAAVLVVSAVEGVQPQTVVLWRVLRRLAVPAAIFINKIDRRGAAPARARTEIGRRLAAGSGTRLLPLTDVLAAGSPNATTTPVPLTDPTVIDVLTSGDDRLLRAALDGPCVTEAMALRSARTQVGHGIVVPIAAGSALTGAGVPDLLTMLPRLMPWARPATRLLSGVIYKIEHGDHGTLAHCRMFGGELRVRDRVGAADARPEVITSLERSTPHGWAQASVARPGDVVRLRGIGSARTGGWVGESITGRVTRQFPAPALESVVEPVNPAKRSRLFSALRGLAEADPLINLRINEERGEIAVSLYGEVQKEVIADLLAGQFGVAVTFRPTVTVHIERIAGTGASFALISEKPTPYLATLGFRVEPAPAGRELYLDHPVTGRLTRALIWRFRSPDGETEVVGIPVDESAALVSDGTRAPIPEDAKVRLWHPVRATAEEVSAWRQLLLARQLTQPVKQAFREVYVLTPAEAQTRDYSNRFAGHVFRQEQARALMKGRGWAPVPMAAWDDGIYHGVGRREYERAGLRAEFFFDPADDDEINDSGLYTFCASDQVRFFALADGAAVPLAEVSPLAFSEAMRDVDLVIGVTTIGADPEWLDRGEGRRFEDYWHRWAFGALNASAGVRREVLAQLVPRLAIAERCTLEDRYLVVRGDLRTYRIHLGSGNILMSPNDQYLCIVSARDGQAGKLFLPFDDDRVLSLILSKAFLLASDTKITDESITCQLAR